MDGRSELIFKPSYFLQFKIFMQLGALNLPRVPEGFFPVFFFCGGTLITMVASPLNFRRKQQEKNPLAPRVR